MLGLLRFLHRPVVAVITVTVIAAFARFAHLSSPEEPIFDEVYYPKAGCILIGGDDETCRLDDTEQLFREQRWDVGSYVHPDLGKWQIGMGIKAFGMTPFGWRATSALAGTLVVLMGALLAQLLFARTIWTWVAGLLLALEHLSIVMSRTALLDVHMQLWVVAAFLALLWDRRWIERRQQPATTPAGGSRDDDASPPPVYSPLWRPWRVAAGVALGAAVAVKWSGGFAIIGVVILAYAWETTRRRRGTLRLWQAFGRAVARESLGVVLSFAVVPLLVYAITWLPWLHHFGHDVVGSPVASLGAVWQEQRDMWAYHGEGLQEFEAGDDGTVTPTHPYYSRPWTWPVMTRPVLFHSEDLGPDIEQVLAIGNPAVFWTGVLALPYLAFAWRRLRDWRAGFILIPYLAQWLPWFAVRRPQFFFYALPLTPFLILGVTYLLWRLSEARIVLRDHETGAVAVNPETGEPAVSHHRPYLPFVIGYIVVAVGLTLWFWPVLTAGRISDGHWRAIVWFDAWI
jgi:dolichyl-phosphate-mannose-protein mannosyltransferase